MLLQLDASDDSCADTTDVSENFAGNGENDEWAFCYIDAYFPPPATIHAALTFIYF